MGKETSSYHPRDLTEWEETIITTEKLEEIRQWEAKRVDDIIKGFTLGSIIAQNTSKVVSSPPPKRVIQEEDNSHLSRPLTPWEETFLTPDKLEEIRRECTQRADTFISSTRLSLSDFVVNPMANVIMNFLNLPLKY